MRFIFFLTYILCKIVPSYIITSDDFFISKHIQSQNFIQAQSQSLDFQMVKYLAEMSFDAYLVINSSNWYSFNNVSDISIDRSTVKGYIFQINDQFVVSIKGTSILFDTINFQNDRFNDNLFFSCCYYKQSNLYNGLHNKCDINTPEHTCSQSCYLESAQFDLNYMNILDKIGSNLERLIDLNKVIFTGHSLGGFLATYMAIKYNRPAITFETPGTKRYLDLIGLNYTNASKSIYHFGHNADPIFMGRCNSRSSLCYIGGYILRTKCHVGKTCTYDSQGKLNISESILTHRMDYILKNIIQFWETDFPECIEASACTDCEQWSVI